MKRKDMPGATVPAAASVVPPAQVPPEYDRLREIDAQVAVAFMGFRWYAIPAHGGPDQPAMKVGIWAGTVARKDGFESFNFPAKQAVDVTGREQEYVRFSDWARLVGRRSPHSGRAEIGLPRYSNDMAAAWELALKIPDRFDLWREGGRCRARFGFHAGLHEAAAGPEAICLAALAWKVQVNGR